MNRTLHHLVSVSLILLAACVESPPLGPEAGETTSPTVALLEPAQGATVAQNVSSIGCPAHVNRGFGFRLVFDWGDVADLSGMASYELLVQRRGALYPIIEEITPISEYAGQWCNAFVTDHNLDRWEWKVRTLADGDEPGPWSDVREFAFQPCRLTGGVACHAPQGG